MIVDQKETGRIFTIRGGLMIGTQIKKNWRIHWCRYVLSGTNTTGQELESRDTVQVEYMGVQVTRTGERTNVYPLVRLVSLERQIRIRDRVTNHGGEWVYEFGFQICGQVVEEQVNQDRIIIGSVDKTEVMVVTIREKSWQG